MSAAELKETKTSLIAWIEQMSDANLLSMLEGIKEMSSGDWWDDLSSMQQLRLTRSLNDAENGKTISSEEFWRRLKNA